VNSSDGLQRLKNRQRLQTPTAAEAAVWVGVWCGEFGSAAPRAGGQATMARF
jgi:hypothetical protein